MKMHSDELEIDVTLVKKLLKIQFPKWTDLSLEPIYPQGTDNVMYKLGIDKVVRLPRMQGAVKNLEKESVWLPKLGKGLSLSIPKILAVGKPSTAYPLPWLVCSFLEGKSPSLKNPIFMHQAGSDLAFFVQAMQNKPTDHGPKCSRGLPLKMRDQQVQESILLLEEYPESQLREVWEYVLQANEWDRGPVWIHGDLHPGNILVKDGIIKAVVDFGLAGIGDPACDLMVAWTLLDQVGRDVFFEKLHVDDATWLRGMGWALFLGIVGYPYYKETNPIFATIAKKSLDEVLLTVMKK